MNINGIELKPLNVIYNDEDHSYTLNGKLLAGVSSISGLLPKPFLIQWAASECAKYVADHWSVGMAYSHEQIDAVLKDAKVAHRKKKEEAAQTGTDMHYVLEQYVKSKLGLQNDFATIKLESLQQRALEQVQAWERGNNVKWLACELLIADEDQDFAGRLDAVAEVNGRLAIIDFKTSKQISDEYYLQTAGYFLGLKWMGLECLDRIIIRIPKSLTIDVYDRKTKKYNTVPNDLEIAYVPTDLAFDCEVFLKLRAVYKWINQKILKE